MYHQVATLHLVAESEKARERTERTVRKVCEFAEIKLGEYRRVLRRMTRDWDAEGPESESDVDDADSQSRLDEATDEDEDAAASDVTSIETESSGG